MTPLQSAIALLQEEFDSYSPGTQEQPREGTAGWYLLRAASLGLSYLKRLEALDLYQDPAACERLYRRGNIHFKAADVPAEEVVEREKLPDGSLPSGAVQ